MTLLNLKIKSIKLFNKKIAFDWNHERPACVECLKNTKKTWQTLKFNFSFKVRRIFFRI